MLSAFFILLSFLKKQKGFQTHMDRQDQELLISESHRLGVVADDEPKVWNTCCSKTEPSFIKYMAQLAVSASVLGLAMTKIASGSTDSLYPSLLMLILGVYIPTPSHEKTP